MTKMKNALRVAIMAALLINTALVIAQNKSFTEAYKEKTIQTLSQLMNDFYVYPNVAKATEEHLLKQLNNGHFDQFNSDETFAAALTESVQSINKDKHMRIRVNRPYEAPEHSPERAIEELVDRRNRSRNGNSGFKTAKILDGNVGYLDLRGFAGMESGKAVADAYMKLLSRTDAVIIDVSKNGGGSPNMVQYLCSFFFDEHLHLNSLYFREGDQMNEFWTLGDVGGDKMPDVPLFVITSEKTFSGAEEFSYNMQTQKRATLVGQTTGGGANPGRTMRLCDNLNVFIPTGRAINPITKTSWEGTGVVPEVKTTVEEALHKAHSLAKSAAEEYRAKTKREYTGLYMDLYSEFDEFIPGESDDAILEGLTNCMEHGLFGEWDINGLGYEYLMEHKKPKVAQSIFRANTTLHPNSPNVYDSYAESFMVTGDMEASVKYYQKAVDVALENEDRDIDLYRRNLENAKSKLGAKK